VIAHVIGALSYAVAYCFFSACLRAVMVEIQRRVTRWLMFAGLSAAAVVI
jgi:hypothetical protein